MEKKQSSISLSSVLMQFVIVMLGCMFLCCLVWYFCFGLLLNAGIIYHGYVSNQQVENFLSGNQKNFVPPGENFLAEYVLFDRNGKVLKSNISGKKLKTLTKFFHKSTNDIHVLLHTYDDESTIIIHWQYRAEFVNHALRSSLPPFEYMWLVTLGAALILCLLFNTLWLRRHLAAKLMLFSKVSKKIGAQELDFEIPHAGIREYDEALGAMEHMRKALYISLSSQWAAQQEREAEISALTHDLKTPLTLVGGNAELLLDEALSEKSRKMVEAILISNERAKQYVASLLETSKGTDEIFENTSLPSMFDELCHGLTTIAEAKSVCLQTQNSLEGYADIQKDHILRALFNIVQNAIEHTPSGRNVYLEGSMADNSWQIVVRDEGPGFSKAALRHAKERLWRDDAARSASGHNGLGLWFAAEVVKTHSGELYLCNCDSGGMVTIKFWKHKL